MITHDFIYNNAYAPGAPYNGDKATPWNNNPTRPQFLYGVICSNCGLEVSYTYGKFKSWDNASELILSKCPKS